MLERAYFLFMRTKPWVALAAGLLLIGAANNASAQPDSPVIYPTEFALIPTTDRLLYTVENPLIPTTMGSLIHPSDAALVPTTLPLVNPFEYRLVPQGIPDVP